MYLCSSKNSSMWFKRLSLMPQFGHSNQWIGIPVNQLVIIFTQTSSSWENYLFESRELLHFSLVIVQLHTTGWIWIPTYLQCIEDVYLLIHFQKCHSWKCQNQNFLQMYQNGPSSNFWEYLKMTLLIVPFLKVSKSKVSE